MTKPATIDRPRLSFDGQLEIETPRGALNVRAEPRSLILDARHFGSFFDLRSLVDRLPQGNTVNQLLGHAAEGVMIDLAWRGRRFARLRVRSGKSFFGLPLEFRPTLLRALSSDGPFEQ